MVLIVRSNTVLYEKAPDSMSIMAFIVQRLGVEVPEGLITHLPGRVFHRKAHGLGNGLKGTVSLRHCGFDQILNGLILLEGNLAGTFY